MEERSGKIHISNVTKSFKGHEVLKDVSLECLPGNIYGIVGHNGCGKTVLFKCICGFLIPESGTIRVCEREIGKDGKILSGAGIIIEEPAFLGNKSGYQNLDFLYRIRNKKDKVHIRKILQLVGLDPDVKKPVKNYSLGMRQRLAIAQAIMEEQEILILDEPMNGLDKNAVKDMRTLFLSLKEQGKTILLASHNKDDIDILCDKVFEMNNGLLEQIR